MVSSFFYPVELATTQAIIPYVCQRHTMGSAEWRGGVCLWSHASNELPSLDEKTDVVLDLHHIACFALSPSFNAESEACMGRRPLQKDDCPVERGRARSSLHLLQGIPNTTWETHACTLLQMRTI